MKPQERNNLIAECVNEYMKCHDKYFPASGSMTDEQWANCVHEMDAIADKYRKNPIRIETLSGALCMAFLNDLEEYHKKWLEYEKKNET